MPPASLAFAADAAPAPSLGIYNWWEKSFALARHQAVLHQADRGPQFVYDEPACLQSVGQSASALGEETAPERPVSTAPSEQCLAVGPVPDPLLQWPLPSPCDCAVPGATRITAAT